MHTGEFFCHAENLVIGNLVSNNHSELGPFIKFKRLDQVSSHVVRVSHTNYVVAISWDRSRAAGNINAKREGLEMGLETRHSPVVHEETRNHPGIFQSTSLEAICRIEPVLDAGVNWE